MGTITRIDRRAREHREVPAFRLAEAGMEVTARSGELRRGLEEMARRAWGLRDPFTLRVIEKLLRPVAALEAEGRRIAGWADEPMCADGIGTAGHGVTA
jgi:hypothetical protein